MRLAPRFRSSLGGRQGWQCGLRISNARALAHLEARVNRRKRLELIALESLLGRSVLRIVAREYNCGGKQRRCLWCPSLRFQQCAPACSDT